MFYTIIESFSREDGDRWTSYCAWRGIQFERFDSIDSILRPSLCQKPEKDDWSHIVNENFMLHYFTDFDYAAAKQTKIGKGDLVGVEFHDHDEASQDFLGFDLIDSYHDVSVLTNWGNDVEIVNRAISKTGLIYTRASIEEVRRELLRSHGNDAHVAGCEIVSIYKSKPANKALVPTPASVTDRAGARSAPDAGAAHL